MTHLLRALTVALFGLMLAACSPQLGAAGPSFAATDVTGAGYAQALTLDGTDGRPRSLADFRGKAVVVFFGYTHCPDVCPTTLSELSQAMRDMGPLADQVQVLFVSVDPQRDTPELLHSYVTGFDRRFAALTGSAEAIARTARAYKVVYQQVAGPVPADYTIDHSAGAYLYDPAGSLRVYVPYGSGAAVFRHDLTVLLGQTPPPLTATKAQ